MVLNRATTETEAGEPITEERYVEVDPHVAFEHGDLVGCDGDESPRVVVEFTDADGERREVEGEAVRFDAWSNYSGSPGGHNIYLRTDDEWVQSQDPKNDYLVVHTRSGANESVVEVNRPGAGMNKRVATDRTAGDNIVVRLPDGDDSTDDEDDAYERFTFPSWYAVQNEGAESAPDGFPEAGLLEGADDVRVGYLSNRTDNMVEVAIDVDEVVRHGDHSTDTYWFAGNPHGRDSDRYEVDFGTVTTRDSKGRLIKVGNVRYVDVPAERVRTDGGSDVDPTPTDCGSCGKTHPRESLRKTGDGLRCPKCYHEGGTGVDEDAFDAVTGEHDDDYADTVEVVGTRDVERQYGDGEVETTAVLRYTVEEPTGNTLSYDINAVRIGCPDCKTNTTALIRPDGSYECVCGYSNDLTSRATLFHQQTEVDGVWYPY